MKHTERLGLAQYDNTDSLSRAQLNQDNQTLDSTLTGMLTGSQALDLPPVYEEINMPGVSPLTSQEFYCYGIANGQGITIVPISYSSSSAYYYVLPDSRERLLQNTNSYFGGKYGNLPSSRAWSAAAYGGDRFLMLTYGSDKWVAVGTFDADGKLTWTESEAMPANYSFSSTQKCKYVNGKFYYTSNSTAVYVSDDGITWETLTMPFSTRAIAYGDGVYVAVGPYNMIARSTDGVTWETVELTSAQTIGSNYYLSALIYAEGKFFAFSGYSSTTKAFLASEDGGVTWEKRTVGTQAAALCNIYDAVYCKGYITAINRTYGAFIVFPASGALEDGKNTTAQSESKQVNYYAACETPWGALAIRMKTSDTTTHSTMATTDGVTWNMLLNPASTTAIQWAPLMWSDDGDLIYRGYTSPYTRVYCHTKDKGKTWKVFTLPLIATMALKVGGRFYFSGYTQHAETSTTLKQQPGVVSTEDFDTVEPSLRYSNYSWARLFHVGDRFYFAGASGNTSTTQVAIFTSTTGKPGSWGDNISDNDHFPLTSGSANYGRNIVAMTYHNGMYIAAAYTYVSGQSNYFNIFASSDGIMWREKAWYQNYTSSCHVIYSYNMALVPVGDKLALYVGGYHYKTVDSASYYYPFTITISGVEDIDATFKLEMFSASSYNEAAWWKSGGYRTVVGGLEFYLDPNTRTIIYHGGLSNHRRFSPGLLSTSVSTPIPNSNMGIMHTPATASATSWLVNIPRAVQSMLEYM